MSQPRFSDSQALLDTIGKFGSAVSALLARLDVAEDVIRAAKGPDSTARTVEAIDTYQGAYGPVAGEYGEPGSSRVNVLAGDEETVPWEAYVALMADYLESEGKLPTPERLNEICRDELSRWSEKQFARSDEPRP